jgi:hypothetical protein
MNLGFYGRSGFYIGFSLRLDPNLGRLSDASKWNLWATPQPLHIRTIRPSTSTTMDSAAMISAKPSQWMGIGVVT